jgi:hypothetical protein
MIVRADTTANMVVVAYLPAAGTPVVGTSVPRSYLAGLGLSTAGGSATMTIAAGQATDSTNAAVMTLASSIGKTTSAWAVGTGNGGLDTGAIANTTWYHFYQIMRPDTGVVDVLFSLSASAPTMPANYTLKRRIGSGLTSGAAQWVAFVQDGDTFKWLATVLDVNASNPGTSAVLRTLSVPTGIRLEALFNLYLDSTVTAGVFAAHISDPSVNDEGASESAAPLATLYGGIQVANDALGIGPVRMFTNTSAQVRSRLSFSDANVILRMATLGWVDRRGRDD